MGTGPGPGWRRAGQTGSSCEASGRVGTEGAGCTEGQRPSRPSDRPPNCPLAMSFSQRGVTPSQKATQGHLPCRGFLAVWPGPAAAPWPPESLPCPPGKWTSGAWGRWEQPQGRGRTPAPPAPLRVVQTRLTGKVGLAAPTGRVWGAVGDTCKGLSWRQNLNRGAPGEGCPGHQEVRGTQEGQHGVVTEGGRKGTRVQTARQAEGVEYDVKAESTRLRVCVETD